MKEALENTFDLRGRKLLVAEDDPIFALILKSIFKSWKNTIAVFAGNGKDALDRLMLPDFDLVLMDLQMPVMDGYQLSRAIRSGQAGTAYCHIPIIALTADLSAMAQSQCQAAGIDDMVIKPTDSAGLFAVIAGLVSETSSIPKNSLRLQQAK
ncbi:Response regulator receiver domain-containing protein [Cyclobacterium lianum]|uniref:Response regulator receiver domain-containing protein n=1 Tax=Cyclobacterium lianum TaxID=388280 RepID=A0A1M7I234_9BACT|nr:response regulator [Cyclobacterium lianum]SHM34699.1 Response regulator receiver domain-containing protein [Cyclobacterium lianum]